MSRTILVSSGGAEMRGILITETTGKDIHADTATVALVPYGTTPLSTDFAAPDVKTNPTNASIQMLKLISSSLNLTPGNYVMYGKVTDAPEIVPLKSPEIIVVA